MIAVTLRPQSGPDQISFAKRELKAFAPSLGSKTAEGDLMAGPVHYELYIRKTVPAPWSLMLATEERKHAILSWLRDNPKLVTFEKFLKQ